MLFHNTLRKCFLINAWVASVASINNDIWFVNKLKNLFLIVLILFCEINLFEMIFFKIKGDIFIKK
ncbi:hypothetical protein DYD83_11120 [Dickeya fangzhongdai]|uniref:Uncharacterized protein n=1 Tax=Dickeya fangzhongdai TaxID=1778540 RepID=A0A2K8QLS2_9GAMM|nr:hypothetical protein CVE23_11070 [Dickeya fangzhongdai]AYH48142.1 hypothetical protein B6N31_10830 [Dickeya fangzhongdai]QOH47904.1 hypothetical protein DYD82_11120 [Dickeya fangzhongdai]QOH52209.1 hypothetical protein DYD83_11120 [Dickeya fangzhongdai]